MVKLWESRVEVIWREIYDSGEMKENATIRKIRIVQTEGELQRGSYSKISNNCR
jgi:hypothetical protein